MVSSGGKRMALRIRTKFVGILLLSAGLPLAVALVANILIGQRKLLAAQRVLFAQRAQTLATSIDLSIMNEVERIRDWSNLIELHRLIPEPGADSAPEAAARLDAAWAKMDAFDPALRRVLENPAAAELRRFQSFNPLHSEMLLTDARGALIAATGRTSDYWQADEAWWTEAAGASADQTILDGIHFDPSAGVYAFELSFAIRDGARPGAAPVGVLKTVLRAHPLLEPFRQLTAPASTPHMLLMDAGGGSLFEFAGRGAGAENPGPEAAGRMTTSGGDNGVVRFAGGTPHVYGFRLLNPDRAGRNGMKMRGVRQMYVVVACPEAEVLAPIRAQLWPVLGVGLLLLAGSLLAGFQIAERHIIAPIERLRVAAERLSVWAKEQQAASGFRAGTGPPSVEGIDAIRTGDEIEELAVSFGTMARRVLGYHEQLERDIATKTSDIRRDLQFARDFQRSLLPGSYPAVGSPGGGSLKFHHIYQPATAVSGDFFDIMQLSESTAAVFIADVMGHGARSALATAILATLMQEFRGDAGDPARFLDRINRQFHEVVRAGDELLFVTAFHAVFDTREGTIRWACAGHHAPVIGNRSTRDAGPLYEGLPACPALGLLPAAAYANHVAALPPDSVILLFTDGVLEAPDPSGLEFGRDRITASVRNHLHLHARAIAEGVVADMRRFSGRDQTPDDVCLVTVELQPYHAPLAPVAGGA
jgi:sigma-B regulation protein RsbU (phosphoserine phosphatase)